MMRDRQRVDRGMKRTDRGALSIKAVPKLCTTPPLRFPVDPNGLNE